MGPQHRFDMGGMGPPFLPRDMTAGSKSSGMLAAKTGTTELYCLRFFWVNKSARDRIGKIIIVKIITISCPPHLYPRTQPRISWHERGAPAAKFHPPPVQTFSPHPKFQPPPVETFTPARHPKFQPTTSLTIMLYQPLYQPTVRSKSDPRLKLSPPPPKVSTTPG